MFLSYFANLLKRVDASLKEFIHNNAKNIDTNEFLQYYYNEIEKFLFSGGKRIRPILMVTAGKAVKPGINEEGIIKASLCLELLHNASLIHDDIMDNAETRRGETVFHKVLDNYSKNHYSETIQNHADFGVAMGILGGDFVYNMAYKAIHVEDFPPEVVLKASLVFNEGFFKIVRGVIIETDLMGKFNVSEKEYFEMIEGKTAALFETATIMGAILANATESQITNLGLFGKYAGIAFQIVDDIIGSFGNERKTGKPTDSDIKEGKKTLLLIKALEYANGTDKETLEQVVGNRNASNEEIESVREIFRNSGALEYSKEKANELYQLSLSYLGKTEPTLEPKYKKYLSEIAEKGVNRDN
jgi:geranylgeranyl diphosphate synthase type I